MTVSIKISVDGRAKMTREESQALIEEAAQYIEDSAKVNAPYKTGELVNSIGVEHVTSRSGIVSAKAEHAIYQEEGTRKGITGQKFMENAMNDIKSDYSGKLKFQKIK